MPLASKIQNAVHGDGEELTAALQTYDRLQGAVAKAERGSARASTPDPANVTDTRPSQGDSYLGSSGGGNI